MRRYVIIGSGAAGMSAAEAVRRLDPTGMLWVISDDVHGYYSRPGLAYYLTGDIPREMLFPFPKEHWRELGIRWHTGAVTAIDPDKHVLTLEKGQILPYDRLLIATGAEAQLPDIPGNKLEGVLRLDGLDDADLMLRLARRWQSAVVSGGGITALEIVEALAARGMKVHYLLRGDRYWNSVLDESESRIVEDRLKDEGILIHYKTNLVEIMGRHNKVAGDKVANGESERIIPCSVVGVAIGIRPRTGLAKAAGVQVGRGIRVSEFLETSATDVFAAGDVAEVRDPLSGEYVLDSLWGPAIEMGIAAGWGMSGQLSPYVKSAPFNVTRLAGLVTTIIGQVAVNSGDKGKDKDTGGNIMRGDSEVWRKHPEAVVADTHEGSNRVRLYMRGNLLAGALVMGDQSFSRALQRIIRGQHDIGDLREVLTTPGVRVADVLENYIGAFSRQDQSLPSSSPSPVGNPQ
jgi:NAD(P)H-nitrite reductase large subunit